MTCVKGPTATPKKINNDHQLLPSIADSVLDQTYGYRVENVGFFPWSDDKQPCKVLRRFTPQYAKLGRPCHSNR